MKKTLVMLVMVLPLALFAQEAKKSILEEIKVSAVGVYNQAEFTHGPSSWGGGADFGLPVNKFVEIHGRLVGYEDNEWRGSAIDETTLYGKADFVKFAKEKFRVFGTGGGTRLWNTEDWAFHIGLGAQYNFTDRFSAGVSREIRAKFKGERDYPWFFGLTYTF